MTMRKIDQTTAGSDVYALLQKAHMTEHDRRVARDAMRIAVACGEAAFWVKEKFAAFGTFFLRPSVKH
jgi:hypothetical protein